MGANLVKADLHCRGCDKVVEHTINTVNRWASPKAHVHNGVVCATPQRLTQDALDEILAEPDCPDCGEAPCHPQCVSGGGL